MRPIPPRTRPVGPPLQAKKRQVSFPRACVPLCSAAAASELGAAARDGNIAVMRTLLASGADCDVVGAYVRQVGRFPLTCKRADCS